MSLPKKGLRSIEVNGKTYNWTIRKRPTSGKTYHLKKLTAAIQIETELKRGLLRVDFGVSPPNNWRNPHKTSITPQTIELVIKKALKEGWDPFQTGTYEMIYPIEFVPDPNPPDPEHAQYDIRWDSVKMNLAEKNSNNEQETDDSES